MTFIGQAPCVEKVFNALCKLGPCPMQNIKSIDRWVAKVEKFIKIKIDSNLSIPDDEESILINEIFLSMKRYLIDKIIAAYCEHRAYGGIYSKAVINKYKKLYKDLR